MVLRLDRSRRAGPHLEWKVRLFAVGAVLGLAGIFLEEAWLTGVAIVVLAGGALLRFVGREASSPDPEEVGHPDEPTGSA